MANEHIINNNIVISGSISSSIGFFGEEISIIVVLSLLDAFRKKIKPMAKSSVNSNIDPK